MTTQLTIQYTAIMIEKSVHEWDKENGQGAYIQTSSGYEIGVFNSLKEAIKACKDEIYYTYPIDLDSFNENTLQLSVIEDDDGYQDDNGSYIADYFFSIEKAIICDIEAIELVEAIELLKELK